MVKYTLKEKILKFLIENQESFHSIREISQKLKVDYKNASQALGKLDAEIYSKKKQGNTYLIEFNPSNNLETISIEEKRTKEFLDKNSKLKLIQEDIKELNYPFIIVLLFGSFVNKKNISDSDLDMCIISDNKKKSNELYNKLNLLSLNLDIQEFSLVEFESMLEKRENNLGHEIIKNKIILYGKEAYYNLVSKWMRKE